MSLTVTQKYLRVGTSRKVLTFCKQGFKQDKKKHVALLSFLETDKVQKNFKRTNVYILLSLVGNDPKPTLPPHADKFVPSKFTSLDILRPPKPKMFYKKIDQGFNTGITSFW
jgi:hypothetical protein